MRVALALLALVAVAAAANINDNGSITTINGVTISTATFTWAVAPVPGTIAKIVTTLPTGQAQGNDIIYFAKTACGNYDAAAQAQLVKWDAVGDGANVVVYLTGMLTDADIVCTASAASGSPAPTAGVIANNGAGTPLVLAYAASGNVPVTDFVSAATGMVYFGFNIELTGKATFPNYVDLAVGPDVANAHKGFFVGPATGAAKATLVAKNAAWTADADLKPFYTGAIVTDSILTAQGSLVIKYVHATTNSSISDVYIAGSTTKATAVAANYTVNTTFEFTITNAEQGPNFRVYAVPKGKTCDELNTAGMYLNATSGTKSGKWTAAMEGEYAIYVRSWNAGYTTVACTADQMWKGIKVVKPPMPPPSPAPAPAPAPVAPAPAAAASTTGTSSASALRGGLLAAFACVLAGLGVSAAF